MIDDRPPPPPPPSLGSAPSELAAPAAALASNPTCGNRDQPHGLGLPRPAYLCQLFKTSVFVAHAASYPTPTSCPLEHTNTHTSILQIQIFTSHQQLATSAFPTSPTPRP
jgi:hypothetical protein